MLLHIATHPRQIGDDLDAQGRKFRAGSDARSQQYGRRGDGAGAEQYFGVDVKFAPLAGDHGADTDGTPAIQPHAIHHGLTKDSQIGTMLDGVEVGVARAAAFAVARGAIYKKRTGQIAGTIFLAWRHAHLGGCIKKNLRKGMKYAWRRYGERAVTAMNHRRWSRELFGFQKIRIDIIETPTRTTGLAPSVVVSALPADVYHAVDATAAAQHFARRPGGAATVG